MKYLEHLIHAVVPHKKHGNIPHLLKAKFVGLLAFLMVMLFFVNQNNFAIIRGLNLTGAVYPAVLADMTNSDRAVAGVSSLAWSKTLEDAARMKAEDMVASGYFAHTSPAGVSPWFWFNQAKYSFIYAGENLAIDFTESEKVEQAWLNSPTHRANVLNENFTEMGIVALDGNFSGRNTTFVVEFFGKPMKTKVASANTTKVTTAKPKTTTVANTKTTEPEVAGASTENVIKPAPKTNIPVKVLTETSQEKEKFISVQNLEAGEVSPTVNESINAKLSTWYMRLAVSPTNAIKAVYELVLALVMAAMLLFLTKEWERHHTKHLITGLFLIALTGALFYMIKEPAIVQAFL